MATPTLTRPLKVGGTRTYADEFEYLHHEAPILADEVDADIQLIVDAWNTYIAGAVAPPQYYLVAGAVGGVPPPSVSLGLYVAALAFTFPANLSGSQAVAKTAATAQTDVDVRVNGTSKGSIRWGAGATVAGFVWSTAVSVAPGDRIELVAPTAADATLADLTWTLRGAL
jgi:hypothetical protein